VPKPYSPGSSPRDELLRAFRIGPEDLEANRRNVLGPRQVRRMSRNIWFNVAVATLIQVALLMVVLLAPGSQFISYAVIGVLVAAVAALEVVWVGRIRRAIRAGAVQSWVGPVLVQSGGRGGTWLTVQGGRFRLWTAYWHVDRGRAYRVYVAPAAQLVVAMEPDGWG
jgi:hypothetical protein